MLEKLYLFLWWQYHLLYSLQCLFSLSVIYLLAVVFVCLPVSCGRLPYSSFCTWLYSLWVLSPSNIILVWKDKRLRRINLGKQLNQQNSFSLRNILKTSLTQCNLFLIFFLFYMPSFCVKFCSSTCPLLWLVLFRCIHLIDLLYWCCTYLSILQYILIIYGMTQNIPTWKRLWPQRHLTLFSY